MGKALNCSLTFYLKRITIKPVQAVTLPEAMFVLAKSLPNMVVSYT